MNASHPCPSAVSVDRLRCPGDASCAPSAGTPSSRRPQIVSARGVDGAGPAPYAAGAMKLRESQRYRCAAELPLDALRAAFVGKVELAILFGSVASGQTHAESDVDIAAWPKAGVDLLELTREIVAVLGIEEVDLADLRRASGTLSQVVATRGCVLFEEREGRFAEFASLAERRWQDDLHRLPDLLKSIDLWLEARGVR